MRDAEREPDAKIGQAPASGALVEGGKTPITRGATGASPLRMRSHSRKARKDKGPRLAHAGLFRSNERAPHGARINAWSTVPCWTTSASDADRRRPGDHSHCLPDDHHHR